MNATRETLSPNPLPEEWRPVVGWEGMYEVSSHGRVRSVDRITGIRRPRWRQGRLLTPKMHQIHPRITLCRGGADQQFDYCIHRLVCEAFHGPPPTPEHVVRHLNGIPTDNRPANVVWGTRVQNGLDMLVHGTAYWAKRTHCKHGHEYTEANTRWVTKPGLRNPFRQCRECKRISGRRVAK